MSTRLFAMLSYSSSVDSWWWLWISHGMRIFGGLWLVRWWWWGGGGRLLVVWTFQNRGGIGSVYFEFVNFIFLNSVQMHSFHLISFKEKLLWSSLLTITSSHPLLTIKMSLLDQLSSLCIPSASSNYQPSFFSFNLDPTSSFIPSLSTNQPSSTQKPEPSS